VLESLEEEKELVVTDAKVDELELEDEVTLAAVELLEELELLEEEDELDEIDVLELEELLLLDGEEWLELEDELELLVTEATLLLLLSIWSTVTGLTTGQSHSTEIW
jgi:hypothetical protein